MNEKGANDPIAAMRAMREVLTLSFILLTMGAVDSGQCIESEPLTRFTFTQYHMGIDARLVVYAKDRTTAETACSAAFKRIGELDSIMSDYRRDSELNLLCDKAGGPAVKVSDDLFKVIDYSQKVSKNSDGAFDISVGPLVSLWRKARKTGVLPLPEEIMSARKLVGWQKVVLHPKNRTIELKVPGMKLDLGGIAKGYAGDEAQRVLKKLGVNHALVELGGDIVVSNSPPGTKGWLIRVPNAGRGSTAIDLAFHNCAISTSGDTEQFVVIGGVQYSHVVDPRTGQALTNRTQATVIARNGLTTDPLSTALTVLDEDSRKSFLRAMKVKKVYVKTLFSTPAKG